jgi:hypothetical protein
MSDAPDRSESFDVQIREAEIEIVQQQLTIARLRAAGHVVDDAENHLQVMMKRLTMALFTKRHAAN